MSNAMSPKEALEELLGLSEYGDADECLSAAQVLVPDIHAALAAHIARMEDAARPRSIAAGELPPADMDNAPFSVTVLVYEAYLVGDGKFCVGLSQWDAEDNCWEDCNTWTYWLPLPELAPPAPKENDD